MERTLIAVASLLFLAPQARAQDAPAHVAVPDVEPRPADVATIDGIVSAFYEVVSGPAGQPRDWGRDATLYLEPMTFTVVSLDSVGRPVARTISKQQFVDESDAFLVESGFTEREIHRETRRFGNIAHAWSTYEWSTADGRTGRGINGIDLFHDGDRWWITHATWESEREDNPIPAEYLP
ncbi:MAG TPA: hypothetical protein VJ788_08110 [Gemmatimonadota bacterium]|nr:hypothetical protein [Gemmatimonadota bacterium]